MRPAVKTGPCQVSLSRVIHSFTPGILILAARRSATDADTKLGFTQVSCSRHLANDGGRCEPRRVTMGLFFSKIQQHPVLAAAATCVVFPVLLPLLMIFGPFLFTVASGLLLWRLLCQRGGPQLAQSYQQSPLERIIPLSYPAQPQSAGSSPPNSPEPARCSELHITPLCVAKPHTGVAELFVAVQTAVQLCVCEDVVKLDFSGVRPCET